jgi:pimeloyl-ACP methyl ester carboxylesterase
VGASRPAFDCDADPERLGVYSQPFMRPETLDVPALLARSNDYVRRCTKRNGELFAHMSSADMGRDFDLLRAAVSDEKLTYIGSSYGTLVGATYASLFPGRARALLLTSPMDADAYVNRPFEAIREQSAGVERGLERFSTSPPCPHRTRSPRGPWTVTTCASPRCTRCSARTCGRDSRRR